MATHRDDPQPDGNLPAPAHLCRRVKLICLCLIYLLEQAERSDIRAAAVEQPDTLSMTNSQEAVRQQRVRSNLSLHPEPRKRKENNAQGSIINFHNRQKLPVGCHKALNEHPHFRVSSWGIWEMEQIERKQLLLAAKILSWTSFPVPKSVLINCWINLE